MCIELNAHSLITFLLTVGDTQPSNSSSFVPWMLGSQSCESKCWENPPAPVLPGPDDNESEKEDEDDEEEEANGDECVPEVMQEIGTTLDTESIASEIAEMVN